MLTELSIKDFAIIDEISVTFEDGLTVLTGETGAGKSIIIDAVQLLAGGRGSVEYVRHGSKKAEIEGLFTISNPKHMIYKKSQQYGIDIQDGMIVLHRTITSGGKSICRVNGKLVTLAILREFGKTLVDIHSQHESQSLMDQENHIELLDLYDKQSILKTKEEYTNLYNSYLSLKNDYHKLSENEQEMNHRLDLLEFQLKELEEANLQPNEDKKLEEERNQLVNFENIYLGIQTAYNALYGENKGLEWLNIAKNALEENSEHDPLIEKKSESLTNYYYLIEELSFELRDFRDNLHYDSYRLDEIETRLNEIDRLKKKYGSTVNEMLEYMAKIEEEIDQIKNKDSHLSTLEKRIQEISIDAYLEAQQLHDIRKKSAKLLTKEIHRELDSLYLENAKFSVSFDPIIKKVNIEQFKSKNITLHKNGFDHVRFLITTNPGEPLKEIRKVASGGELSRIMLIIKKIFAKHQGVTSVIFDEVDTGVSGRVAQAMAEKIYQISNDSQVLCITHLPQVAAMADSHKLIQKHEQKNRTTTNIQDLTKQQTVEELSRMITGTELTETALEHGEKLLDLASDYKKSQK